jgi:hypothetical protein
MRSVLFCGVQKYSFIRQSQRAPQQRVTHWKDVSVRMSSSAWALAHRRKRWSAPQPVELAVVCCGCFCVLRYWLSGLGLVIFGSLGDFAALSMVAQSIVAPCQCSTHHVDDG